MIHLLAAWTLVLFFYAGAHAAYVFHERRDDLLGESITRHRVRPDMLLPMRIALQQNKHAESNAEAWLKAVSDPDSPSFGAFWSQDEIIEAFKPEDNTVHAVKAWLASNGIEYVTHSDNKQWLAFDLSAKQAEELLKTKYYERVLSNGGLEISCDSYMLPSELQAHIHFVKPGVKTSHLERSDRRRNVGREALYNFETLDPSQSVSKNNSMGIFEEEFTYYQGDLDEFYTYLTDIPNGTTPIDLSIDGGIRPPSTLYAGNKVATEPNLDIQCAIPIIYPQNVTIYQTDDPYYAHQVDYAYHGLKFYNDFLDAIDGSYCTYSAFGETGNDPKHDPTYPDPRKGGYKGKLQCGVFKPTNVISISYGSREVGSPYYYQKRQCNEWLKLALQGVSVFVASGDDGSECGFVEDGERELWFLSATIGCPWITGVGATQIGRGMSINDSQEATTEDWAGIISGGGFSFIFDTPWYQKAAISKYFKVSNNVSDLPYFENGTYQGNRGIYNRNGRGSPDLSAIGAYIVTWSSGLRYEQSGTSASTPIVGALFNRIIEERIRAGKRGRIGLVNPTLYKNPGVLTDITKGDNGQCVKNKKLLFGKEYGYNCTEGWDPVTGLGTPKYPEMLKVFMDLP